MDMDICMGMDICTDTDVCINMVAVQIQTSVWIWRLGGYGVWIRMAVWVWVWMSVWWAGWEYTQMKNHVVGTGLCRFFF